MVREAIPEAEEIAVSEIQWVSGSSFGSKSLMYSLQGPDLKRLEGHAAHLMEKMRADPDLVDVGTSFETGKPEIEITIERDVAAELGVPAVVIGRTIRTLLAGEEVGSFEEGGERYDVRVQVLPEYRDDPRAPRPDPRPRRSGRAHPDHQRGARAHRRRPGARSSARTAPAASWSTPTPRPGVAMSTVTQRIAGWTPELDIRPPDKLEPSGRVRSMEETAVSILFAFALALLAIYMVLASLFNSLVHPFTIMISAPLSFIGGFLALKLSGTHLDMMSAIAFLVLMGLVMKNGILLVDYTNQLRAAGRSRVDAALEAAPERLRPVLMTSVALDPRPAAHRAVARRRRREPRRDGGPHHRRHGDLDAAHAAGGAGGLRDGGLGGRRRARAAATPVGTDAARPRGSCCRPRARRARLDRRGQPGRLQQVDPPGGGRYAAPTSSPFLSGGTTCPQPGRGSWF